MNDFIGFSKIPRLNREIVVTEKIDGTNGCIYITEDRQFFVGSRTRWISPINDNHGFAKWAYEHKDELIAGLGIGRHFGEWWGQGINRNYGLSEKRFSLFNVAKWCLYHESPKLINIDPETKIEKYQQSLPECCSLVPVLGRSATFETNEIDYQFHKLRRDGSQAVKGFMQPEGIVVCHTQGNILFKATLENDDKPKGK